MKPIITFFLLSITFSVSAQTNFTGKYTINKLKIAWGNAPESVLSRDILIEQDKAGIKIKRTSIADKETLEDLKFDGATYSRSTDQNGKATTNFKWSEGRKTFQLAKVSMDSGGKIQYTINESWELIDNEKELKLTRNVVQSNGLTYTIMGYYEKK